MLFDALLLQNALNFLNKIIFESFVYKFADPLSMFF
uniref:Uncharacterized protein n=1 Tax=Klebsiella pneumoniae TaxID=573 RepID=A0A411G2J3_KLEPN|nr:hypothetical protein [Klebsiella pneumoniae]WIW81593.1 hypothetical protein [Salmonella sp.]